MTSIIGAFTAVWAELATYLTGLFPDLIALFYADGNLTFVGVMAVIMAGISIMLLVWNLIRSFFAMRG